jgi:predicted TIM-barrel fold metal-dependent hydrolase
MPESIKNKPIINCHVHVFKSEHVPPFLAKTIFWWPLYYLVNTRIIIWFAKHWYKNEKVSPHFFKHKYWYKNLESLKAKISLLKIKFLPLRFLATACNIWLIGHALFYIFQKILLAKLPMQWSIIAKIKEAVLYLNNHHLIVLNPSSILKYSIILFVFLFIKSGRKLIWSFMKQFFAIAKLYPDKQTIAFTKRYLNIGRFAIYNTSNYIFRRLKEQYDAGAKFIVLPMDMDFMDAGKVSENGSYKNQMQELVELKQKNMDTVFPFVFIDPRRIIAEANDDYKFLSLTIDETNGKVHLLDCAIKTYIETNHLSGFKIYPALGYYPFDDRLLLLWKYAADNQLPIMTHAIRGNIYYRGTKKTEWFHHPIFKQSSGKANQALIPLLLPEKKNIDFINNFTHPLNFLCLLDETLLRQLVAQSSNPMVKKGFGYTDADTALKYNLSHLKICFGHYGGDDEWQKYFEGDRSTYTAALQKHNGIQFLHTLTGQATEAKIEEIWKSVDWYSIISSLMMQYKNVYADISYILQNEEIYPLLKSTLQHPILKTKVLFGTDFYVVRNHKSERQLVAELKMALPQAEFEAITYYNPLNFLGLSTSE